MPTAETIATAQVERRPWLKGWDPSLPVLIGTAFFLIVLMLLPLGAIFTASFWDQAGLTFSKYIEVFSNRAFLTAIWNPGIISALGGPNLGGHRCLLAWLITRTDLPWKKSIR